MAAHSSILAWRILWTEEPGGLQSVGSRRVGQDRATEEQLFPLLGGAPASLGCSPRLSCAQTHRDATWEMLANSFRQRQHAFTKGLNSNTAPYTSRSYNLTEHLLHMKTHTQMKTKWLLTSRNSQSRKFLKFFSQYRQNQRSQIQFQSRLHWHQPAEWLRGARTISWAAKISRLLILTKHSPKAAHLNLANDNHTMLHLLKVHRTKLFR